MFPQRKANKYNYSSTTVIRVDEVLILLCKSTSLQVKVKVTVSLTWRESLQKQVLDVRLHQSDSFRQVQVSVLSCRKLLWFQSPCGPGLVCFRIKHVNPSFNWRSKVTCADAGLQTGWVKPAGVRSVEESDPGTHQSNSRFHNPRLRVYQGPSRDSDDIIYHHHHQVQLCSALDQEWSSFRQTFGLRIYLDPPVRTSGQGAAADLLVEGDSKEVLILETRRPWRFFY